MLFIRDGGAGFQGDKGIVIAGVNNVGPKISFQKASEAQRDIKHQALLHQAFRADGAGIVATMAGIYHDAPNLQAKRANQAAISC